MLPLCLCAHLTCPAAHSVCLGPKICPYVSALRVCSARWCNCRVQQRGHRAGHSTTCGTGSPMESRILRTDTPTIWMPVSHSTGGQFFLAMLLAKRLNGNCTARQCDLIGTVLGSGRRPLHGYPGRASVGRADGRGEGRLDRRRVPRVRSRTNRDAPVPPPFN